MLGENIKALRKNKGLTQEDFAIRINVVRQTVSKWENGLSVPDADILRRIADVLETDVSKLLGGTIKSEKNTDEIAEQLSRINEQLVIRNRRSRRIWKTIGVIVVTIVILYILLIIASVITFNTLSLKTNISIQEEIIVEEP